MHRRSFLWTAAVGALAAFQECAPRVATGQPQLAPRTFTAPPLPWFDGSYDELPTLDQQMSGLAPAAVDAQIKPRISNGLPVTGLPLELNAFDEQIAALVKSSGMVGVAYAVGVERKLKVARGIGYLSSRDRVPATPTAPGVLCSITKPLCAMTGLTLVRDGKLQLDQQVVDILPLTPLLKPGEKRQPEIDRVTIRMLMSHMSGLFNAVEVLFDRPYYKQLAAQGKLTLVHGDISQYDLVRRGMSIPFVSQPGAEFHYSGQGLQVLGRIVEWLSRMRLDKAMVARALAPLGIQHHAQLCYLAPQTFSAISAGLASRSHTFIPSPYDDKQRACLSWAAKPNDNLYGQQWGQADSCGASMLSAINLLRFVTFCTDLLGNDLMTEALTPPKTPPYTNGLGWGVSINKGRYQYGHSGAITGMRTMCESMSNGVQYAVIAAGDRDNEFNSILKAVRDLGHSLRKGDLDIGDWQAYGFQ